MGGGANTEIHVAGLDRQGPSVGHRVLCIDGEIQDDLLDLARIGVDASQRIRERESEVDVLGDQAAQHSFHTADDRGEVEDFGLQDLLAAHREQLPGERRGPFAREPDLLEIVAQRGRVGQVGDGEVGGSVDDRQEIVEIVRDAAC